MTLVSKAIHNFFIPSEENHFRPQSLERSSFLIYILVALVLKLGIMSFFSILPKTVFYADVARLTLVNLTNEARMAKGLPQLSQNPILEKAAQAKAQDLLTKGYFAHESPDGKTPWYWFLQAGYKYLYAGENLAIDFVESTDVVQAWLNSPGHRANIENKNYREIGIAVVNGKYGDDANAADRIVVVQLFGNPANAAVSSQQSAVSNLKSAATPKPALIPTKTPIPRSTPPSPPPTFSPTAIPATTAIAITSPTSSPVAIAALNPPDSHVLGQAQLPLGEPAQQAGTMLKVSAKLMTAAERFAENIFFAFLAFVVVASLLNIFIRHDVQHADLIARTFMLMVFFLALIAVRHQTFLNLVPGIL